VTLETWCDKSFAATRWSHRSDDHAVLHLSEGMLLFFQVVPTALCAELSQNFDRGLRSIRLLLWHVQVVHKDNAFHAQSRSVDSRPDFVELHVDDILDLVAMSLSRETNLDGKEFCPIKL